MSTQLAQLTRIAREEKGRKFLSLAHLLTPDALHRAFRRLRKKASAGVDGVTYEDYEKRLEENINDLHERLRTQHYRANPLRRVYIEKEDGKQRPLSIPCLEDKLAQKATVELMEAIYEADFLDCSYGFRPGRSAHDALRQLWQIICRKPVSYVLEVDICAYFDSIVRQQLMEFIERRIKDGGLLRLIGKWLQVGVIDEGRLLITKTGTGQGQPISPLLANVYLHYVLDEWFEQEVKPRLRGAAYLVRYADDLTLCFQYRSDAEKVQEVLRKRFDKYGLTLHPDKTRLLAFGRFAEQDAARRGKPKPDTFDFLGFTHVCARSRTGKFTVHVRTMKKRLKRGLKAVADWCQKHRHDRVSDQQRTLNQKLRGHYQYYGLPTNYERLKQFYRKVKRIWKTWLNRRGSPHPLTWSKFDRILIRFPLILPNIPHPWSTQASVS